MGFTMASAWLGQRPHSCWDLVFFCFCFSNDFAMVWARTLFFFWFCWFSRWFCYGFVQCPLGRGPIVAEIFVFLFFWVCLMFLLWFGRGLFVFLICLVFSMVLLWFCTVPLWFAVVSWSFLLWYRIILQGFLRFLGIVQGFVYYYYDFVLYMMILWLCCYLIYDEIDMYSCTKTQDVVIIPKPYIYIYIYVYMCTLYMGIKFVPRYLCRRSR